MSKIKNAILIAIISFNLRIALNVIMANMAVVQADLNLNNFQGGLLTSVPLVCMGLFALLVNQVQKRFGQRIGIGFMTVWLGIGSLLRFAAHNYGILLISTIIVGSGIAIIGPLVSGYIKRHFPDEANVMVAVYTTSMGIGGFTASALSPALIAFFDSWQYAAGVWGFVAILAATVWMAYTSRSQVDDIDVTQEVEEVIGEEVSTGGLWRDPILWQLIMLYGIQAANNYSFSTWIQPYALSQGFSAPFGSTLVSLLAIIQTMGNFTIPLFIIRPGRLKAWTFLCGLMVFLGAILMFMRGNQVTMIILSTFLIGYGGVGIFNIALIIPIRISVTPEKASVSTSLMQTVGYLVAAIAPMLVGMIIDSTGFVNTLTVLNLFAGLVMISLAYGRAVRLAN